MSGNLIGPRIFFTGSPLDGNRVYYDGTYALDNEHQMLMELDRAEKLDYDFIKTYVRLQDSWQEKVVQKAHAMGLPVTSHRIVSRCELQCGRHRAHPGNEPARIFSQNEPNVPGL